MLQLSQNPQRGCDRDTEIFIVYAKFHCILSEKNSASTICNKQWNKKLRREWDFRVSPCLCHLADLSLTPQLAAGHPVNCPSLSLPMNQPMNAKRERYSSLWQRELSNKQGTLHPAATVRPWSQTRRLLLCGFSPCGGTLTSQERIFETHMQKSVNGCVTTFWVKCI